MVIFDLENIIIRLIEDKEYDSAERKTVEPKQEERYIITCKVIKQC